MPEGLTPLEIYGSNLENAESGEMVYKKDNITVQVPKEPWMPTHGGVELRVECADCPPLVATEAGGRQLDSELLTVGRMSIISAEIAKVFSEADDTENPDWYNKPWFNVNINSQLQGERFPHLVFQVYIRPRTMGYMRGLRGREDRQEPGDEHSNPYWGPPIPVDYPLNPDDRGPYAPELLEKIKTSVGEHLHNLEQATSHELRQVRLFTDENGSNTLEKDFDFKCDPPNHRVWQKGDYLLVTQDNPLVARKDGVHLVLIYRGEQQGERERFGFHWRDPRRIAEMTIIASAVSAIVTQHGYAGHRFDKSYIHLNANWSLDYALPEEERHEIMDFGSFGWGKWPGSGKQPPPNAHPHIQLLREKDGEGEHDLVLSPSPGRHDELSPKPGEPNERVQTPEEITALSELLDRELTPLLMSLQGKEV